MPVSVCYSGGGIGLVALLAPLDVWLGLWDFRHGFDLLRFVNSWADWIAVGALIIAAAIFIIGKLKPVDNVVQLSAMAAFGSLIAAMAWYIPESFRPPEGTPQIHDIVTDPIRPLEYIAIAPLRADAANSMEYGSGPNMNPRRLMQLQQQAYPDIVPQRFDSSVEAVFNRAMAAIDTLGWEIVEADLTQGRIEATDTTFWFCFKDDIVIHISLDGNEQVLNARSLSRVGIGDVGKNAARLREFFALLK
ncbi:MAG: DUF1499 domain-containing protein [Gammaproteobacteria bacterium]|jgi:uncharacterized protein (DUF1499 family)|nr:DUF1499 domain-containing protein [Gammaproteobacteria bacterium]